MNVIFATWPEVVYQAEVLTQTGAVNRLVSYYFSRTMTRPSFRSYAETGVGIPNPKKPKVGPLEAAEALAASAPLCDECGEPQFDTPSGLTCPNGHGGAASVGGVEPPRIARPKKAKGRVVEEDFGVGEPGGDIPF